MKWLLLLWMPLLSLAGSWIAFYHLRSVFAHAHDTQPAVLLSGSAVARKLLEATGARATIAVKTLDRWTLASNYYQVTRKQICLARPIADSCSVAAFVVTAHEVVHALQFLRFEARWGRKPLIRAVGIDRPPLFMLTGVALGFFPATRVAGMVLFVLLAANNAFRLPIEIAASRQALVLLGEHGFLSAGEISIGQRFLRAALVAHLVALLVWLEEAARLGILAGTG
jgi:Zn-dependent membrane protease YugP